MGAVQPMLPFPEGVGPRRKMKDTDPRQAKLNPNPTTPGYGQNPNLSGWQFHFDPGVSKPGSSRTHLVKAVGPTGTIHGTLEWHPSHGEIGLVAVHPRMKGQGIATAMWHRAHAISLATRGTPPMQGQGRLFDPGKANRIVPPRHSKQRTEEGNRWAHSVGGYIPPWQKVSMYEGAED